jgi:hypothetical protein
MSVVAAAAVGLGAVLGAGCATPPPDSGNWIHAPTGTVTTYLRRSSGSLGAGEGQVVWKDEAESDWQGRRVLPVASPQAGTVLYDAANDDVVALFTPGGTLGASFDPPVPWYRWPLAVGKTWTSAHTMTLPAQQRKVDFTMSFKVEAHEDVTVPAGTFKAYRVVGTSSLGDVETRWVDPALGALTIRRTIERPASHPQGAGRLEGELLSRNVPR